MKKPNGFDLIHLRMAEELIKGEKSKEEYIQDRGITTNTNLKEIEYLFRNPLKFNLFLDKLSVGARCLVMKRIFNIDVLEIANITGYSKTTIYDFFKATLEPSEPSQNRFFSDLLIYHLAIIFDLPLKYLLLHDVKIKKNNTFDEYELHSIPTKTIEDTFNFVYKAHQSLQDKERFIGGIRVENNLFDQEKALICTRVDINKNWFIIELHLSNHLSINNNAIKELLNYTKGKYEVFVRDPFLREGKKLIIFSFFSEEPIEFYNDPYLNNSLLY